MITPWYKKLYTKVNILERKIPDVTTLIHKNHYNTNKQNLEKKIGNVENTEKLRNVEKC